MEWLGNGGPLDLAASDLKGASHGQSPHSCAKHLPSLVGICALWLSGPSGPAPEVLSFHSETSKCDPGLTIPINWASRHRADWEFGWGGTPFTRQRRRPEARLRWDRNLSESRRAKALLMLRLSVEVHNMQVWLIDPLDQCTSLGYQSQRCQKNYHRDNWLVAAKRS